MVLRIFNTATQTKEVFTPIEKGVVRMYVCGVTPYDLSHVGHGRSYVAFDVIRRSLEYLGYNVRYIQNFTDVDDKIIERAKKEGVDPLVLSDGFIKEYLRDMFSLGVKRAERYPLVSENIPEIIKTVKGLVEKGAAYVINGDVYLDISKKKDYGKLSGHPIEELKSGARVDVDTRKKSPIDFALWKKARDDEISWPSPWGSGRPGWHIECSVMSTLELGPTLDIHGGGQDLIFPHHENEIAQSELYTGKPFVRYWLHNGLVTVDGEKMSKSLGNFITIRELLDRHSPMVLRFFLLSAHYRRPLDYSERAIEDAGKGLRRIQNVIHNLRAATNDAFEREEDPFDLVIDGFIEEFRTSLEDDFNVPMVLSGLFEFIRGVNTYLAESPSKECLERALNALLDVTSVLGLTIEDKIPVIVEDLLRIIIRIRNDLRREKDFEKADHLRQELEDIGITLEDRTDGTTAWRFA